VIVGHGHAPEHASLYCEVLGVLISGDQILPRITTNVSVWPTEPEADPLRLYLDSIPKFRVLPEDTLVLPSHGRVFRGLHARLDALEHHHEERLAMVLAACDDWRSAAELMPLLFRRELDVQQLLFAIGEAIAHLHRLWHAGHLERRLGEDGVYRFRRR